MAKFFAFSSDKTFVIWPKFRNFEISNGLNHLSTPSGLILAASKVKGGITKYIGNPILSKNIQFSPKLEYLELSKRLPKLIFLPVFAFLRFLDENANLNNCRIYVLETHFMSVMAKKWFRS